MTARVLVDPVSPSVPMALVESLERENVTVALLPARRFVLTRRRQVLVPNWYRSFRQASPAYRLSVGDTEPLMLQTLTTSDRVSSAAVPRSVPLLTVERSLLTSAPVWVMVPFGMLLGPLYGPRLKFLSGLKAIECLLRGRCSMHCSLWHLLKFSPWVKWTMAGRSIWETLVSRLIASFVVLLRRECMHCVIVRLVGCREGHIRLTCL